MAIVPCNRFPLEASVLNQDPRCVYGPSARLPVTKMDYIEFNQDYKNGFDWS